MSGISLSQKLLLDCRYGTVPAPAPTPSSEAEEQTPKDRRGSNGGGDGREESEGSNESNLATVSKEEGVGGVRRGGVLGSGVKEAMGPVLSRRTILMKLLYYDDVTVKSVLDPCEDDNMSLGGDSMQLDGDYLHYECGGGGVFRVKIAVVIEGDSGGAVGGGDWWCGGYGLSGAVVATGGAVVSLCLFGQKEEEDMELC
ncbi:hypothetical protein Tco_0685913 [Tanacetum coccineum]